MPYFNNSSTDRKCYATANNSWYFKRKSAPQKIWQRVNICRKWRLLLTKEPQLLSVREEGDKTEQSQTRKEIGSPKATLDSEPKRVLNIIKFLEI